MALPPLRRAATARLGIAAATAAAVRALAALKRGHRDQASGAEPLGHTCESACTNIDLRCSNRGRAQRLASLRLGAATLPYLFLQGCSPVDNAHIFI